MTAQPDAPTRAADQVQLRQTAMVVVALNLAYFAIEFGVASSIGSVALFADSIDFLEDASINGLILVAVGLAARARRLIGLGFVALLLVPSIAAVITVWHKVLHPTAADPVALTLTAVGALVINSVCALLWARVKHAGGSLSKAAFLSARNDVAANIAMIAAGLVTAATLSIWPDIIVGVAIAALNAGAALEVYEAALGETDDDAQ